MNIKEKARKEDNLLLVGFKIWASDKYDIPANKLRKITYQCGDIGLGIIGGGELCNILDYHKN